MGKSSSELGYALIGYNALQVIRHHRVETRLASIQSE